VSIAALTIGIFKEIFFVILVLTSTEEGMMAE
jgi:uncharacterized membrane protein